MFSDSNESKSMTNTLLLTHIGEMEWMPTCSYVRSWQVTANRSSSSASLLPLSSSSASGEKKRLYSIEIATPISAHFSFDGEDKHLQKNSVTKELSVPRAKSHSFRSSHTFFVCLVYSVVVQWGQAKLNTSDLRFLYLSNVYFRTVWSFLSKYFFQFWLTKPSKHLFQW